MPKGKVNVTLLDGKAVRLNEALINGKKIGLPINLQAPPLLGLTEYQKKNRNNGKIDRTKYLCF